jgi:hypothetical protein
MPGLQRGAALRIIGADPEKGQGSDQDEPQGQFQQLQQFPSHLIES